VGSSIPILTQGISNSESNTNVTQNYQYKDVGVILEVTPQITSTDLIALNVSQEISAKVDPASTDPIQSPSISTRKVESTMTIANGQTMIIGGLIQERVNDSLESLPLINKIPLLKRLLGSTNASVERSEILVLITGYIVNEKSPIEDMIKRYNDAIKALNKYDSQLVDREDADGSKPGIFTKAEFWLE
jgi:general secretion pathway protein D